MKSDNNQITRWILPKPTDIDEINNCTINFTLQKVLYRRGMNLENELDDFLTPLELPNPEDHFDEIIKASQRIIDACNRREKIAICGDYDADGMTSTVLLCELLSQLGAITTSYIPSRKDEGYGLNTNMINDIYKNEIKLVITVDNGISALDAIQRAKELKMDLIITDHHKIPEVKIETYALIHPENCPHSSPYRCLAGVGIAYMLAKFICNKVNYNLDITSANVLFCIGTVADMAPLVGANRKWLKECLPKINNTKNIGVISILKKLKIYDSDITSNDIGFKIAPLINAVGRIGDPQLIINLLTSTSVDHIKQLTRDCFAINNERKRITVLIEQEALSIAINEVNKNRKFLVLEKRDWHPGIIGIVAARIAEKFNLPTAILSMANDGIFRGSIRSNNQLQANYALKECSDLLIAYGGHSAAAGFTIKEENITKLKEKLDIISKLHLKNINITKSIKPDAYLAFKDINNSFYKQLMLIGPFGMNNKTPIFWTRKCKVLDLYVLKGNHLKMILDDGSGLIEAIKWNCSTQFCKNEIIDVAYNIQLNKWKKNKSLQLNILDIKKFNNTVDLLLHKRKYKCEVINDMEIKITNSSGQIITTNNYSRNEHVQKVIFSKKILSFAEVALGRTA